MQYFYPESASHIFFINTPPPFRYLYEMLSPLIHPLTRDRVEIMVRIRGFVAAGHSSSGCDLFRLTHRHLLLMLLLHPLNPGRP